MKMIIRTHTGFVAYFVKLASDASTNVFLGFLCNFRYSNFLNIFDFVRHVPPMQEKISTLSYLGFSRACAGCMCFRAYPDCLFSLAFYQFFRFLVFPRFFALDASSFYLRRIMIGVLRCGYIDRPHALRIAVDWLFTAVSKQPQNNSFRSHTNPSVS